MYIQTATVLTYIIPFSVTWELNNHWIDRYCFDMPPSSYVAAAACCPYLRFLNGETERCVGDDELASIAKSCPRCVDLTRHEIDLRCLMLACEVHPSKCIEQCLMVQYAHIPLQPCSSTLHLRLISLTLTFMRIAISHLQPACIRLKHIRLVGNLTATDVGIAALAAHCPLLEHLDLPRCASISDDALRAIAASCPRLRHLCLTWSSAATDAGVATVAHGCPRLRHVEFEG